MPIQIGYNFTTDLVTKRTHNKIIREVNRGVGEYIADTILPRKFTRQAFAEYPQAFKRRTRGYQKRKRIMVGHNIPNVLTGKMRDHILTKGVGHRITATANGGKVYLRNYFPMREAQRQELEAVNDRDRRRMATRAETIYLQMINDPTNQRKRRVKGS